jgi:hypothetical protein
MMVMVKVKMRMREEVVAAENLLQLVMVVEMLMVGKERVEVEGAE